MRILFTIRQSLLLCSCFLFVSCSKDVGDSNPVTVKEVKLEKLWEIGKDDEVIFGFLHSITIGGQGEVFLVDYALNTVHRISKEGEYLGALGAEGEGPGHFRGPANCFLVDDTMLAVVQQQPPRIVTFSLRTSDVGELPPPDFGGNTEFAVAGIQPIESGYIVHSEGSRFESDRFINISRLDVFDEAGVLVNSLLENRTAITFAEMHYDEKSLNTFQNRWATDRAKGGVAACPDFEEALVLRWRGDFESPDTVTVDLVAAKRSEERLADFLAHYKRITQNSLSDYRLSDSDQPIARVFSPRGWRFMGSALR